MEFIAPHLSPYPLRFMLNTRRCGERTGILTNKIAGDGLVLFSVVTRVGYGGKHIELDLVYYGKSGFLEFGRHRQAWLRKGKGGGATRKFEIWRIRWPSDGMH